MYIFALTEICQSGIQPECFIEGIYSEKSNLRIEMSLTKFISSSIFTSNCVCGLLSRFTQWLTPKIYISKLVTPGAQRGILERRDQIHTKGTLHIF